jgi:hypothetical protein
MSETELCERVGRGLLAVGSHPLVPVEVTRVEAAAGLRIWVTLHYQRAHPVCCGEPGCYIGFLGLKRREVPGALARELGWEELPSVSIVLSARHEDGYRFLDGPPSSVGDWTTEYSSAHFGE